MQDLLDKIAKIEALIAKGSTEGERLAALLAKQRLQKKIQLPEKIEYRVSTNGNWHKQLFKAVCRKYKLEPYRYRRQKYTTVMVRVEKEVMDKLVWPDYLKYSKMLEELVDVIAGDIIKKIHDDNSDETIIQGELKS